MGSDAAPEAPFAAGRVHRHKRAQPVVELSDAVEVLSQTLEGLPVGVKLEPGRIVIEEFTTPTEVYEKLFRLAQAIHNNEVEFVQKFNYKVSATT